MKKIICIILGFSILFAGCGGREANPIPSYLPGDDRRTCRSLIAEMAQLQTEMQRLSPKVNKGLTNALWATAGVFLIVPFFFIDLKDAEKVEFEAMRIRYNKLLIICAEKECNLSGINVKKILSIKESKEIIQKQDTKNITIIINCANCDNKIGHLEKSYIFQTNTVCRICYEKLK